MSSKLRKCGTFCRWKRSRPINYTILPLKDASIASRRDMPIDDPQKKMKQGRIPFAPIDPKERYKRKLQPDDESRSNTSKYQRSNNNDPSPEISATSKLQATNESDSSPKISTKKLKEEKQQKREAERLKKEEERLKKEQEKLKKEEEKQQKKEEERIRKEEERLKREDEKKKREEKKEEERLKKEEERRKKEEEKQKKEDERLRKEEEKQKKEEIRMKKEEKKILEKEKLKEKHEKRKAQFARFFVAKRCDDTSPSKETEAASKNFISFQVKENMKVAPLVRSSLSDEERDVLEGILSNRPTTESSSTNYLDQIRSKNYVKGVSFETFPVPEPDDYCEILSGEEDEDDEDIDGTDVWKENVPQQTKLKRRAKLLQFCENSRPAYYGTWSKKPLHLTGRRPFTREELFDYDYDSDEDWEEVENGESLSDSDGEAEGDGEEAGEEDYEVDNDFFVPHGYLSDGEGEGEDAEVPEEKATEEDVDEEERKKMEENLKMKQKEFELEMKRKTKPLKPKVYGCVWLEDRTSHPAYDQLVKILSTHRSMVMFGNCPLIVDDKENQPPDQKDQLGDEEEEATKKFLKSFPEKAVPDLIRLIHGNRYGKVFLVREFSEYWKRQQKYTSDKNGDSSILATPTESSSSGCIAKRKIEPKIQEIAQYGRFSEDGVSLKYRTWYVPKEVRKKYGLEDLSLRNSWTYILTPKEWGKDESSGQEEKSEEASPADPKVTAKATPKNNRVSLITKFTKVLTEEERKVLSPTSTSKSHNSETKSLASPFQESANSSQMSKDSGVCKPSQSKGISSSRPEACGPSRGHRKIVSGKRRIHLTPASKKARYEGPKSSPIATLFGRKSHEKVRKTMTPLKGQGSETQCITLD